MRGHEVDRVRGGELGRDGEVALVLAVGRVHDDHELAGAEVLQRLLDRREGAVRSWSSIGLIVLARDEALDQIGALGGGDVWIGQAIMRCLLQARTDVHVAREEESQTAVPRRRRSS